MRMVSERVSPFEDELEPVWKVSTFAPRRFAAAWNDMLVRVEGSKNMLAISLPERRLSCFLPRSASILADSDRKDSTSFFSRSRIEIRSRIPTPNSYAGEVL